jgi:hypothetical protein
MEARWRRRIASGLSFPRLRLDAEVIRIKSLHKGRLSMFLGSDRSFARRLRGKRHAAVLAIVAAVTASSPAWGSTTRTVVYLAVNKGEDVSRAACRARGGCGPEVKAPLVLAAHRVYSIRVSGTVSVWGFWVSHPCGRPESRPEFPTSRPTTPTGDDAQFRFAYHLQPSSGCRPLPRREPIFQLNLGSGWFHPIALGNPSKPSSNNGDVQHPYRFRAIGEGVVPEFRFVDYHPSDNNGEFRIVISRAP